MSRSKPRERGATNPIKAYITYKPNSGEFDVYDKTTKKKHSVKSIDMIILDADRFNLTGYSPEHETGYVSNYVYNSKKEPFTVGIFNSKGQYREIESGFYQDIKGNDNLEGIKYTKPVFGLLKTKEGRILAELSLVGSARSTFSEWFSLNEDSAYEGCVIFKPSDDIYNYVKKTGEYEVVPPSKQKSKRTTWLHLLELDFAETDDVENKLADEQDVLLQKYFESSNNSSKKEEVKESSSEPSAPDDDEEEEKDDLPF